MGDSGNYMTIQAALQLESVPFSVGSGTLLATFPEKKVLFCASDTHITYEAEGDVEVLVPIRSASDVWTVVKMFL